MKLFKKTIKLSSYFLLFLSIGIQAQSAVNASGEPEEKNALKNAYGSKEVLNSCRNYIDREHLFEDDHSFGDDLGFKKHFTPKYYSSQKKVRDRGTLKTLGAKLEGKECEGGGTVNDNLSLTLIEGIAEKYDGIAFLEKVNHRDFEQKVAALLFNESFILKTDGRNEIPYKSYDKSLQYFKSIFPALKTDPEYQKIFKHVFEKNKVALEKQSPQSRQQVATGVVASFFSDSSKKENSAKAVNDLCSEIRSEYRSVFPNTEALEKEGDDAFRKLGEGGYQVAKSIDNNQIYNFHTDKKKQDFLEKSRVKINEKVKNFYIASGAGLLLHTKTFKENIGSPYRDFGENCIKSGKKSRLFITDIPESVIRDGFREIRTTTIKSLKKLKNRDSVLEKPKKRSLGKLLKDNRGVLFGTPVYGALEVARDYTQNNFDYKWEEALKKAVKHNPHLLAEVLKEEDSLGKGQGGRAAAYLCKYVDSIYSSDEKKKDYEAVTNTALWGGMLGGGVACFASAGTACGVVLAVGLTAVSAVDAGLAASELVDETAVKNGIIQAGYQGTRDNIKITREVASAQERVNKAKTKTAIAGGTTLLGAALIRPAYKAVQVQQAAKKVAGEAFDETVSLAARDFKAILKERMLKNGVSKLFGKNVEDISDSTIRQYASEAGENATKHLPKGQGAKRRAKIAKELERTIKEGHKNGEIKFGSEAYVDEVLEVFDNKLASKFKDIDEAMEFDLSVSFLNAVEKVGVESTETVAKNFVDDFVAGAAQRHSSKAGISANTKKGLEKKFLSLVDDGTIKSSDDFVRSSQEQFLKQIVDDMYETLGDDDLIKAAEALAHGKEQSLFGDVFISTKERLKSLKPFRQNRAPASVQDSVEETVERKYFIQIIEKRYNNALKTRIEGSALDASLKLNIKVEKAYKSLGKAESQLLKAKRVAKENPSAFNSAKLARLEVEVAVRNHVAKRALVQLEKSNKVSNNTVKSGVDEVVEKTVHSELKATANQSTAGNTSSIGIGVGNGSTN